jgi:hypothetical protein
LRKLCTFQNAQNPSKSAVAKGEIGKRTGISANLLQHFIYGIFLAVIAVLFLADVAARKLVERLHGAVWHL